MFFPCFCWFFGTSNSALSRCGRRSHDPYAVVGMTALCRVPDYAAPKIRSRRIAFNNTPERRYYEIELIVSLDGIAAFPIGELRWD